MTPVQAEATAVVGADRHLLFGQAAVLLGFVSPDDVQLALEQNREAVDQTQASVISDDVVVLKDPLSPRAADIRRLAQMLALRWFRGETSRPALSLVSADRFEGRTTIATNLASVFARAGVRTLLIDADVHNPSVHMKFGLEPIVPTASGYYGVQGLEKLAVLPASAILDLEYEKFMRTAIKAMIEAKSAEFDVIFVDTPPAALSNDYLLAGLATKGAVLVTREGVTRARAAAKMLNACEDADIDIVGGIMLKV